MEKCCCITLSTVVDSLIILSYKTKEVTTRYITFFHPEYKYSWMELTHLKEYHSDL